MVIATIGVVIGTCAGRRILKRISEQTYKTTISLVVLALGIWMLVHPAN